MNKNVKSKRLFPTQKKAFQGALAGLEASPVVGIAGDGGTGKTVLLREIHRSRGGAFLNMKDVLGALAGRHPLALEETFEGLLLEALLAHVLVIFDDLNLLLNVAGPCGRSPRAGLLEAPLLRVVTHAEETGKNLVFGFRGHLPQPAGERGFTWRIQEFTVEDYAFLCREFLGSRINRKLDHAKIHRFAPHLDAHQLRGACAWLRRHGGLDTERFIDYLKSQHLTSNVELKEVQPVDLYSLKGVEEVIQGLESQIILPLENDRLATELALKPKRGILLSGPPGTGKTTIGRALAHRLKSKFFLIDGKFISGTESFYWSVRRVFSAAEDNAPSIVFIDDCDVIFQNGDHGFYRYLLSMLDGLESEKACQVCVMMTAMELTGLPPALVRSGRIELWLEMRLPGEEVRAEILESLFACLPPALGKVEVSLLARATEDFTGADLKRLVEDGKLLYAQDRVRERPIKKTTEYFLAAAREMQENRKRYRGA